MQTIQKDCDTILSFTPASFSIRSLLPAPKDTEPLGLGQEVTWSEPTPPTPHTRYYSGSSHMQDFLDPERLQEKIDLAVRALAGYEFDSIAFRGMSGALIGPPVALRLNKSMLLVRKDEDDSHSSSKVEGDRNVKRYIILDDFSCSGDTMEAIKSELKEFAPKAECLGLLQALYVNEYDFERYAGGLYPLHNPGVDDEVDDETRPYQVSPILFEEVFGQIGSSKKHKELQV